MSTLAHNTAAKLFGAFVAVAMLFTLVAPAQAQTAEELQKMINDLLAQVAQLQSQLGGGGASASGVCPYTWTRNLNVGASGMDVMKLQQFLNSDPDTRIAATGVGSAGMETEYYGALTGAAVAKFQTKYREDILSPLGLVNATTFFGASSRAKANELCSTAAPSTPGDQDDDDADDAELSGEASLNTVEVSDGDDADDVEEGDEDMQVAEIEVEFNDGDAVISRLDIALEQKTGENGDADPWDVFEDVSLWVDGDEVARFDATDEDEYLDEDDGSIRFSGLDILAREDEEVTIIVAVSTQNSLDSLPEIWEVGVGSMRYVDADDVTTTDDTTGDLQDIAGVDLTTAIADFTINAAGTGDDLDIESSDQDPDATTFELDEDKNVEKAVFAFELSAEDSDGDIELNGLTLNATVTTASNVDDLINDFRVEIDGESFDADSYVGTAATASMTFDINGDVVIPADEVVTVVVYADFEEMEANDEGSTLVMGITSAGVDAEGEDSGEDVAADGSATSETHTFRTDGVEVDVTDTSVTLKANTDSTTTDDEGVFVIEFDVTAFGSDVYIDDTAEQDTTESDFGVNYTIENSSGVVIASSTAAGVATLSSDADEEGGFFKVEDGNTETFELTVEFDPAVTGSYKLILYSVNWNSDAAAATTQQTLSPESDYDTGFLTI